jgi:hypothetical protein
MAIKVRDIQPLVPNTETIAALKAAERGELSGPFNTIDELFVDLNSKPKRAPRGTFDRTAYQRELMRKRRAAKKEQKK